MGLENKVIEMPDMLPEEIIELKVTKTSLLIEFHLSKVKKLLADKKAAEIKKYLNNLATNHLKGVVFEEFIAELFRGNGWIAIRTGGPNDHSADVVLYHPEQKNKAISSFIIQCKNKKGRVGFKEAKSELILFDEKGKEKYNCFQYIFIAVNGFSGNLQKLEGHGVQLKDWTYVEEKIKTYDPENNVKPIIEMNDYNAVTYKNMEEAWKLNNKLGVVQATGTGKSFLTVETMNSYQSEKKIILAPTTDILNGIQKIAPWTMNNTLLMTYSKLLKMSKEYRGNEKVALIVLDEFHRCGAKEWENAVKELLTANPNAKVLGTSATPIRYLDGERDMAKELFADNVVYGPTLAQALSRRILPMPKYVTGLYTLEKELKKTKIKINNAYNPKVEKQKLINKLFSYESGGNNWNRVSEIFRKHMPANAKKFIVFCKDIKHLKKMKATLELWLVNAGIDKEIEALTYTSSERKRSSDNLKKFTNGKDKNTLYLLFSIDKANEGLHIKDIDGVILLRKTASPILYFQQIGRALEAGRQETPIIFDLVENFNDLKTNPLITELNECLQLEREKRRELGLKEDLVPSFSIINETKDFEDLILEVESVLMMNWDIYYQELEQFYKENKHSNVLRDYTAPSELQLGEWVHRQRINKKNGSLSIEKVQRLEKIEFIWDRFDEYWMNGFKELQDFIVKEKHCDIPNSFITTNDFKLGAWLQTQRWKKRTLKLTQDRVQMLEQLGIKWDPLEDSWNNFFTLYKKYKEELSEVPQLFVTDDGIKLGSWVSEQRTLKRQGDLSDKRIQLLDEAGFTWSILEEKWYQMYKELKDYKEMFNDCNPPKRYVKDGNINLGSWVLRQRYLKRKDNLSEERIRLLEDLGIDWEPNVDLWPEQYQIMRAFAEDNKHCVVPKDFMVNGFNLYNWARTQREKIKKGILSEQQIRDLEAIGFSCNPVEEAWNQSFEELKKFRILEGHCMGTP